MGSLELSVRRHLEYAEGYLMLGLVAEAKAEIDGIDESNTHLPEVMEGRMSLYYATQDWEQLHRWAVIFTRTHPEREQGWVSLAFAVRRNDGIAAAKQTLLEAESQIKGASGIVSYNLGCYYCLLDELDEARRRLRIAFSKLPGLKQEARSDPDLRALRGELDLLA